MPITARNLILLTGAGASVPAGLMTLKSIVDGISGAQVPLDNQNAGAEVAKETWKVIRGIRGDNATLEDLLARLQLFVETAELIKSDHVFSDELKAHLPHVISGQFRAKWEKALAFCYRLMLDNYGPHKVKVDSDGFLAIHNTLAYLSSLNQGTLHLFTTNYDCLLDVMALKQPGINFYSHIDNEAGNFQSNWYLNNSHSDTNNSPKVYVHRMHGCIGWFAEPRSPYGIHQVFGLGEKLHIEDEKKLTQMAIKLISEDKVGARPAFSLAFQEFSNALETCTDLLIWGHSFRDLALLRSMINVQSNRSKKFRVHYIDPYLTENEVRENIQNTISGEPDLSVSAITPQRVNWDTSYGWPELLNSIDKSIGVRSIKKGRDKI